MIVSLSIAFFAGIISFISPCVLPLIGILDIIFAFSKMTQSAIPESEGILEMLNKVFSVLAFLLI